MKGHGMDHPQEAISAYLDGELAPAERARVEEHLRGCGNCTGLLEDLRRLSAAAADEDVPPVPADLPGRIAERVRAAGATGAAPRGRGRWLARMPLAAAASLMAAAMLWVIWQVERPPVEVPFEDRDDRVAELRRGEGPGSQVEPEEAAPAERAGSSRGAGDPNAVEERERKDEVAVDGVAPGVAAIAPPADLPEQQRKQLAGAEARRDAAGAPVEDAGRSAAPVGGALAELGSEPAANRARGEMPGKESGIPAEALAKAARLEEEMDAPVEAEAQPAAEPAAAEAREDASYQVEGSLEDLARASDVAAALTARVSSTADAVRVGGQEVGEKVVPSAVPGPRAFRLVTPTYEISLMETGALTLRAGEYECAVSPEELRAEAGGDVEVSRAENEGRALYRIAEARLLEGSGVTRQAAYQAYARPESSPAPPGTAPSRSVVRRNEAEALTYVIDESADASSAVAVHESAIAVRMRALVTGSYRAGLESKCGPLPEPFE